MADVDIALAVDGEAFGLIQRGVDGWSSVATGADESSPRSSSPYEVNGSVGRDFEDAAVAGRDVDGAGRIRGYGDGKGDCSVGCRTAFARIAGLSVARDSRNDAVGCDLADAVVEKG